MFISILYMFRAAMCPSSEELIVSIRHLVYVTLYRWPFGVQVWVRCSLIQTCTPNGHLYRVTYTRCRIGTFGWDAVSSKPAHQTVIYTEWHIPDVVLVHLGETQSHPNLHTKRSSIQSDIYQMSYWYIWVRRSLIQTCTPNGHLYRVTYTRCRIDTINSPDDGHMDARNM